MGRRREVEDLPRSLDPEAGPEPAAHPALDATLGAARRRRRQIRFGSLSAVVAVPILGIILVILDRSPDQRVTTAQPTSTPAPESSLTTAPPTAMPEAVRSTLDAWRSFPVDAEPRPLILSGAAGLPDVVNAPEHGFPDDDTKAAYGSGQFELATTPPTSPDSDNGQPLTVGQQILDRLDTEATPGPRGPAPLTIRSIRLGRSTYTTDRGPQSFPAWLITFDGIPDPAAVLAVAPEALYTPPAPAAASTGSVRPGAAVTNQRILTVGFVGAAPGSGPCSAEYEMQVYESDHAVAVVVQEVARPPSTTTGTVVCAAVGYGRRLTTTLERPLGNRVLVDGETRTPLAVTS